MNSNVIRRVVILGVLSIIGIIGVQSYLVIKSWDIQDRKFEQSVTIALQNVAKNIAKANDVTLPQRQLINQLTQDYYVVNVNTELDANTLQFFLQRELEAVALNTDFEYGIYDCASDTLVYADYVDYSTLSERGDRPEETLPKYDEFDYYFGVRFPDHTAYLLSGMRSAVVFSVILLFTILFFAYALVVILRQKRLSELQKDFINNMTHEFKTPISTMQVSAEVFRNHESIKSDKRLSRYADIIKQQNSRLNDQVEKVLQIARIEKNNFELKREKVDLHELLGEILPGMVLKVEQAEGSLTTSFEAADPIIEADKLHLTNILYNLLDNAIKYTDGKPEIEVGTKATDNGTTLYVKDNGIGISKEHQRRIFHKFFRVPTGNVHNVKGFGLGLFYVKNIARAHGWRLRIDSEPGRGTTMMVDMG